MHIQKLICNLDFDDYYIVSKQHSAHAQEPISSHMYDDMLEIVYCHNGMQIFEVNGNEYKLRGGEVFITFPKEAHSSNQTPEAKGLFYWIQIYIPSEESMLKLNIEESQHLIKQLLNMPSRNFKVNPNFRNLLEQILNANYLGNNIEKKILTRTLLFQLLFMLLDSASKNIETKNRDRAQIVENFIQKNLSKSLHISILSKLVFLSESHFKSWFKKEFGMNAIEYIQRKRIEDIIFHWKKYPQETVNQIAAGMNYSSPQYFASIFKKYTGKTPTDFLKGLNRK